MLKLRCGGLFMLKAKVCSACCAKNMTRLILKTSWKFLTRSPVKDFALENLKINAVRHNIWTQFQRRCYRGIPCFREREIVAEDVLLKVFTAAYCMDHENELQLELPNHKIKSHSVSPRAYMYSRFGGLWLLFTSSSPCRKDQFAISYFSTSLIVLIQVYNWEIRHHSFGFAAVDFRYLYI